MKLCCYLLCTLSLTVTNQLEAGSCQFCWQLDVITPEDEWLEVLITDAEKGKRLKYTTGVK